MTDSEWYNQLSQGDEAAWATVYEKIILRESRSQKFREMMARYSITSDDLMSMLYNEMMARGKIALYRNDGGSLSAWLRSYVRGFIMNAKPNAHGEISIDGFINDGQGESAGYEIPVSDFGVDSSDVWNIMHLCFRDLWNSDPEKAYILLLKTRFHLSSDEIKQMLDISSAANVDQIFSRAVKFMRAAWKKRDKRLSNS